MSQVVVRCDSCNWTSRPLRDVAAAERKIAEIASLGACLHEHRITPFVPPRGARIGMVATSAH